MKKIYPDDVDLENRDPNLINDHLQIGVEDIFGEPNDISSCECAWKNALVIYNNSLQICYRILSGLCCCPLALCWGCTMACVAFNNIWCCTPTARLYSILMTIWRKIISICILSCIAPYYEAIGYLFSNIRLSLFKSPQADDHYEAKFIKVYDPKLKSSNA
ncbi:hypothetical protein SNEBB_008147 [Seison nebaliae]|nr:hypothetical protein SNEBB_008147 [Seison nebaliae]